MAYKVTILFKGFPAMLGLGGWALIQDENHNILLDTGNGYIRPQIKKLLEDNGLTCDQIDTVIFTHLHWDHTFNMDFFPHAKYIVSAAEWEHANKVAPVDIIVDRAALAMLRTCDVRLVKEDGEELFPGMTAMMTPGHTPGCMSVVLDQDGEKWILTGDAVKTRGELLTGEAKMTYDPAVTRATIERIKKSADRILPGHDGWIRIDGDQIIPEDNELVLTFTEGMTANGGQKQIKIKLD